MGHWRLHAVSKDDPMTIVIARSHSQSEVRDASLILSYNQRQESWPGGGVYVGERLRPIEVQITTATGQTAIVLLHRTSTGHERLVVSGHIEGGRSHEYGWLDLDRGKPYGGGSMTRKLRLHVGSDGLLKVVALANFAFLQEDAGAGADGEGGTKELAELEFKIPMFAKPPSYEAVMADLMERDQRMVRLYEDQFLHNDTEQYQSL
ncbi:hypothetical protein BD289DRAFT_478788 [Coniella lustricola]|uniref:Uncharacterized protein n=1 Tax=Coniella lustricola TaxID=2025994 RepID=A0A2T3AL09_9PEZI|nr:hypothetical protein BD289DRAFT_478788 [Coniella lustricola]